MRMLKKLNKSLLLRGAARGESGPLNFAVIAVADVAQVDVVKRPWLAISILYMPPCLPKLASFVLLLLFIIFWCDFTQFDAYFVIGWQNCWENLEPMM